MGISLIRQNTKESILEGLNDAQSQAACHLQGPCMVLAGPGSGKTLTIAKRIEYLMNVHKVSPDEILVITFTKYAAKEMKRRFLKLCGQEAARVTCGTFHGIYYGILKWAFGLSGSNLLMEQERLEIVRAICQNLNLLDQMEEDEEKEVVLCAIDEIEQLKNKGCSLEAYKSLYFDAETFSGMVREYEHRKSLAQKIDFEDMLLKCRDLFLKRPDILQKWQRKFRYILVDEFQDINQVQYDVLKMLSLPENNLFIVGDDDQSIYGFRGADPAIMQQYTKDYPDARTIVLNLNYRSTPEIVAGAGRVIVHNEVRFAKKISAFQKEHHEIQVQKYDDPFKEAEDLVRQISQIKADTEPEEIAVLFRTALDARILSEYLAEYQIPFHMSEKINNIYDHFAVRDILSYLRLSQNERSRKDFFRIMNRPNRYLSRDCVREKEVQFEQLRSYYKEKDWMLDRIDQLEWDLGMIANQTPYAAFSYIRKRIGYDNFIFSYAESHGLKASDIFDILDEVQNYAKTFATIREWFVHIRKYEISLTKSRQTGNEQQGVALLTIHSSKGLEFERVFLLQANEATIPYKKAKLNSEIEEERRLFYVAMTRAKKYLTICYVNEKNGKELNPSRFLCELLEDV